ncbi:squalene synthase [Malassezia psittaci]|uniref:Squalene synthase n=1 Tax=Malassezia psittaci TaxID=1821823 RepID=A0AAF0FBM7_9BASI|nr:squalene synthase [Malassezia psittaci]
MGAAELVKAAILHPVEFRALITYKIWRDPVHDFKKNPEASGYDRERMRECWKFLDMTSRSFAAVIKELKGELSRVICIFYLVLRALDTVEDDMTLDPQRKIPLLVDFHKVLQDPQWTFTESGPNEKDRQLLVEFDKVIAEYQLLNDGCRYVISDICARMGAGMASYIQLGDSPKGLTMEKFADYDLYCHFVAGLVGEGLSGLFSETHIERPEIGKQLTLSNHMGLFLQKTNIIRDYAEDVEEGRCFWPRQCWGANNIFQHQSEIQRGVQETRSGSNKWVFAQNAHGKEARRILSEMLLDAMNHVTMSLDYMLLLRDQSVFNFCATPQVMAIATLALMFDNANVFKKNVKIRKSLAVRLILFAINPRDVSYIFRDYAREIHARLAVDDPNYVRWCVELGRIETWCEAHFPSFIKTTAKSDVGDVRAHMYQCWLMDNERAVREVRLARGEKVIQPAAAEEIAEQKNDHDRIIFFLFIMTMAVTFAMASIALVCWLAVWYYLEDETDPLTIFLTNCWSIGRQAWRNGQFSWNPWINLKTAKSVGEKAAEVVTWRMEALWSKNVPVAL